MKQLELLSYQQRWWLNNKHRYKESRRVYEKEYQEKHPEKRLYNTCKSRAKKNQIPFNLTLEDIKIGDVCPVLNQPFRRCTPYAPSIDRIIPELGYVRGNIQIISKRANVMKNDGTPEDLRNFALWVLNDFLT